MATPRMFYILILSIIKVSGQSNTWALDSMATEQFLGGILSFLTTTATVLQCSQHCLHNGCSIFSFDAKSGNCTGFHSFAAAGWSSTLVETFPGLVFQEGLDKVYIMSGSLSLRILKQKASYQMAKDLCSDVKGRLPIIDTDEKITETLSILGQMAISFWIGLSDNVTEGTWLWEDGTPLSSYSTVTVKLNNFDGSAVTSEQYNANCAVLNRENMRIGDNHCEREYAVVCEKSP